MNIQRLGFEMTIFARGYIASGEFNGNRMPQHLQNQIVKSYCDVHGLKFVLSRAEYWINGATRCQLWAALKEGFNNIVFFSLWQLPNDRRERDEIYNFCLKNDIILHFAAERMSSGLNKSFFVDLEILIESNLMMSKTPNYSDYFDVLAKLI